MAEGSRRVLGVQEVVGCWFGFTNEEGVEGGPGFGRPPTPPDKRLAGVVAVGDVECGSAQFYGVKVLLPV